MSSYWTIKKSWIEIEIFFIGINVFDKLLTFILTLKCFFFTRNVKSYLFKLSANISNIWSGRSQFFAQPFAPIFGPQKNVKSFMNGIFRIRTQLFSVNFVIVFYSNSALIAEVKLTSIITQSYWTKNNVPRENFHLP